MPRARNIKPGFFTNEVLAECGPWARLCFAGLWTLADREGRLEDRAKRIKGELFRFDAIDVDPLLDELQAHGFLVRYRNAAGRFIQILAFKKHQSPHYSEKDSVIDPPTPAQLAACTHDEPPERSGTTPRQHGDEGPERSANDPGTIPERSGTTPGVDPSSRGGRNPLNPDSLNPDSGFLIPDSGFLIPEEASSLRSEAAGRRVARAPPTPSPTTSCAETDRPKAASASPPFDGNNAERLNGKAVVVLADAWELPEQWGVDAEALGWTPADVLREAERFRQYWTRGRGQGTRRSVKGWSQSWSNWLAKAANDKERR